MQFREREKGELHRKGQKDKEEEMNIKDIKEVGTAVYDQLIIDTTGR